MTAETSIRTRERTGYRFVWWRETMWVVGFYVIYTTVRNNFGSGLVGYETAFRNAERIIDIERALGLYHEETIQDWALSSKLFIQIWNIFYGTFHFLVTGFAVIWTYVRRPDRYRFVRNSFAAMTALALVGFATFPLLPPRLLPEPYGFVDTLVTVGGLWSFDSGTMQSVTNKFAAMPSLHFGWALWCTIVLVPILRNPVSRALLVIYPVATLFAIIVTGNHYWIDAVGGLAVVVGGLAIGRFVSSHTDQYRPLATLADN